MDDSRPLTPKRAYEIIMQLRSGKPASSDNAAARRLRQQKSDALSRLVEQREREAIENQGLGRFLPPEVEADRLAADDLRNLGVEYDR